MAVLQRLALDPSCDVERLERLYALYEQAQARAAKAAYLAALARLQPTLPVIEKRGRISRGAHKITGQPQAASAYARYEDAIAAIAPRLAAHGFSLSFRIDQLEPGRVRVTGILGHADGHSEETALSLPLDDSGGKNNVQAWGSAVSYGKRYVAFALLNIVAREEDDDGAAAGGLATITEAQEDALRAALEAKGIGINRFCAKYTLTKISDLPAERFDEAMTAIARHGGGA